MDTLLHGILTTLMDVVYITVVKAKVDMPPPPRSAPMSFSIVVGSPESLWSPILSP